MKILFTSFLTISISVCSIAQIGTPIEIALTPDPALQFEFRDFESDGDMDMIYGEAIAFTSGGPETTEAVVIENIGGGLFQTHVLTGMQGVFCDIDGDGLLDLLNAYDVHTIYYKRNLGNFQFAADVVVYTVPQEGLDWGSADFWSIGAGDLDNDGDDEILITSDQLDLDGDGDYFNNWGPTIGVIYMTALDVFADPIYFIPGGDLNIGSVGIFTFYSYMTPFNFKVLDYNSDGYNDLIVDWSDLSWEMGVFYGQPDGSFIEEKVYHFLHWYSHYSLENLDNQNGVDITSTCYECGGNFGDPFLVFDKELFGPNNQISNAEYIGFDDNADYTGVVSVNGHATNPQGVNLDGDPLNEIIYFHSDGHFYVFDDVDNLEIDTIPQGLASLYTTPFYSGEFIELPPIEQVEVMDIDNNGTEEFIFICQGHVYMAPVVPFPTDLATIQVNLFIDANENGILDLGESPFVNDWIHINPQDHNLFINANQYEMEVPYGTYTIDYSPTNSLFQYYSYNYPNWMLTSPGSVTVTVDALNNVAQVNFGVFTSDPLVTQAEIFAADYSYVACTSIYNNEYITYSNTGNVPAQGTITYVMDSQKTFVSAYPAPSSIAGNVIQWEFTDLGIAEWASITINSSGITVADIGSTITNTATIVLHDGSGNDIFTDNSSFSAVVTCAYDPNDITEQNGFTDSGYILDGDELQYTIRFQNTGNAPATNVRIENQLSELLQRNTLQPLAWSHDFELLIDENDKAIFTFNDINLPDSTNNEAESHGFITYRILPITGLAPQTVINNTAEIYFDINPAVVTNTEVNTIYDCMDLQQASVSEIFVCSGEQIMCNNNALWTENLSWSFNGNEVGTGNYIHTVSENGMLTMHSSNALCEYSQDFILTANTANANFTANGNTLTANDATSYQWYLNGIVIAGATQQTYEITETGNYSVVVVDVNECDDVSEQVMATYTGVAAYDEINIAVYPNPANDKITISISESLMGAGMKINNELGQEVWNSKRLTTVNTEVDCSAFSKGVYTITISNTRSKLVIE